MEKYAIQMDNISKKFGNFFANKDITFKVKQGSIHAIVGENGAGKSTLMNILFGLYKPTSGEIKINGEKMAVYDSKLAANFGLGMVHQHFKLVEALSVIDNIVLGYELKDIEVVKLIREIYNLKILYYENWFKDSTEKWIKANKINSKYLELMRKKEKILKSILNGKLRLLKKEYKKSKKMQLKYYFKNFDIKILNSIINFFNKNIFKFTNKIFQKKLYLNLIKERKSEKFKFIIPNFNEQSYKGKINLINHEIELIQKSENVIKYKTSVNKLFKVEKKYIKLKKRTTLFKTKNETAKIFDYNNAIIKIKNLSKKYNLEIDATEKISNISVGMQQRVEILKMLYRNTEILILDEPTAMLSPIEIEGLLKIIKLFKEQGKTIIMITHKLNEVKEVADRCTIIRKGRLIKDIDTKDVSIDELAEMMVGTKIIKETHKQVFKSNNDKLLIKNLSIHKTKSKLALDDVSLSIRNGEIFGIAGVEGNGQIELAKSLLGLSKNSTGTIEMLKEYKIDSTSDLKKMHQKIEKLSELKILVDDENILEKNIKKITIAELNSLIQKYESIILQGLKRISHENVNKILKMGFSYIPEDRLNEGVIKEMNLIENSVFNTFYTNKYSRLGFLKKKEIILNTKNILEKYDVRIGELKEKTLIKSLSGGNQQKFVIGREYERQPEIIIAVQPSRGLDIGAINLVHKLLLEQRNKNKTIILISYELDEILDLSDRIGIMSNGKLMDVLENKNLSKEYIGRLMLGAKNG